MSPPKKEDEKKIYQFGQDLARIEKSQDKLAQNQERLAQDTVKCFNNLNKTMERMAGTLEKFSGIAEEQAEIRTIVKRLEKKEEKFESFMSDSHCKTHEERFSTILARIQGIERIIKHNTKANDTQSKNIATFIIAMTGSLITAIATYFITKGG